jgi:hypothetical protein
MGEIVSCGRQQRFGGHVRQRIKVCAGGKRVAVSIKYEAAQLWLASSRLNRLRQRTNIVWRQRVSALRCCKRDPRDTA